MPTHEGHGGTVASLSEWREIFSLDRVSRKDVGELGQLFRLRYLFETLPSAHIVLRRAALYDPINHPSRDGPHTPKRFQGFPDLESLPVHRILRCINGVIITAQERETVF